MRVLRSAGSASCRVDISVPREVWFRLWMEFLSSLIAHVRGACVDFPDARRGDILYSMADIGLSVFSLFFMRSETFLSCQRSLQEGRKASNCRTLFGMAAIPIDNHVQTMLDPVHPSHLQPAFDGVPEAMSRRTAPRPFHRLGGRVMIALDGTEYFCSRDDRLPAVPDARAL